MDYLSNIPSISSLGIDGNLINLEVEGSIEKPPGLRGELIIFTANNSGRITVIVGHLIEHEICEDGIPNIFTRLKIKGSCVEFTT